tara:strand:- start:503 stop:1096 length:594 start_codon:yes stop_codon:yes gene_type:complete
MPTGYTADVQSGKITEFSAFAMQCARAFGAPITMRDESRDAEIPEKWEPSDFYAKRLLDAKIESGRLLCLTDAEAQEERDAAERLRAKSFADRAKTRHLHKERYNAMYAKVCEWSPPSAEHEQMKRFMKEQLAESVEFDCPETGYAYEPLPDAATHLLDRIKAAAQDIKRYTKENDDEIARTDSRNKWLSDLRASFT